MKKGRDNMTDKQQMMQAIRDDKAALLAEIRRGKVIDYQKVVLLASNLYRSQLDDQRAGGK